MDDAGVRLHRGFAGRTLVAILWGGAAVGALSTLTQCGLEDGGIGHAEVAPGDETAPPSETGGPVLPEGSTGDGPLGADAPVPDTGTDSPIQPVDAGDANPPGDAGPGDTGPIDTGADVIIGDAGIAGTFTFVGSEPLAGGDLVGDSDTLLVADLKTDGVFDVIVTGPITALVLVRTNGGGVQYYEQWDTLSGADKQPTGGTVTNISVTRGDQTPILGVYNDLNIPENDLDGHISLGAGAHTLTCRTGSNATLTGSSFVFYARLTNGTWKASAKFAY